MEDFATKTGEEGVPAACHPFPSHTIALNGNYFSLLGGTNPFSRIYSASVAYCSLSCDTFPHSSPTRDRFALPQLRSCASLIWFTTRAKVRISGVGLNW